jgi:hypothetical protein
MDPFESPFWDLTAAAVWALTREPAAVRAAADTDNNYALLEIKEDRYARLDVLYQRLWAESRLSKPDDPRDLKIDILATDVDLADLPPPFDERRAERVLQLEAEGKIRVRRDNTFPIVDYLTSLFQAGWLEAVAQATDEVAAHVISAMDWAFLEVAGGDHQRLFVRRIDERGATFGAVRVKREQVLAVFPPPDSLHAPTSRPRPKRRQTRTAKAGRPKRRAPERLKLTIEGLKRLFPKGPRGKTREEIVDELRADLGLKSLSFSTLDRAKKKVWRTRSPKRIK